ncbi:PEP/pyruvate-binding domain-containing protein [Cellulomonas fimi]|uniref:Pyruvate phosphate dikinase PEP/pyruvate-binding protein n=1 Tax=Cellulomonas fimi (strain ATCC 484 / DSM 20113 / JCM 1341 / CCUG 24087 / LMG 16345 / NBRC 15513 / NCIMB 8980 / NCTC 7547 / NRS-133) TaxID=590998 RepID=F4H7J9_CELFA|nr:PEP/pyruvate-binding domain-containing protein [Cellulomonas fimi]AEE44556.1 pyruvate phosphate dikinase PEP/pyruvate-binding protein [Cellulomonas fimi ATCC 484]NNH06468.1 pyruvate, phosphate dikinase [Cellulomonas fimi]VEH26611.1 Phosphoenolpyruvate synthase [Cellulomonas fimi]
MIVPLREAVPATCGGKAGTLGALLRAGLPVPDGFVVPRSVHRAVPAAAAGTAQDARPGRPPVRPPTAPTGLADALARGLRTLGDPPVAVRSSADDEDTAHASAAGQYDTVLAVEGAERLAQAVRACWASLHGPRAAAYRRGRAGHGADAPGMAVLVQRHLDPQVAGVMLVPGDPDGPTLIEATWGLGTSVVDGTVTPDTYRVAADGSVTCTVADKRTRTDRRDGRLVTSTVADVDRRRPALDDPTATRLAALGRRVAAVLAGPQDVEWAVVDGEAWVLQARPVTADVPAGRPGPVGAPAASRAPAGPPDATRLPDATAGPPTRLVGTPGSAGRATGPARVVRGPADFARTRPGDVLVCPWTDPGWTPLLHVAAAVVTEAGGVLAHAAIVARERGIPAVLGVTDATTALLDGTTVTVDGTAGTVTVQEVQ